MPFDVLIYLITIVLTLGLTLWIIKRYHLTRYQVLIFVLLVLFWSSINIVRAYRKSYALMEANYGGLALGVSAAATIAAAYGLISIFARFPVFLLSDYFKSRKLMIGGAMVAVGLSSLWVVLDPHYYSLLFSSFALGLGASMLSLFNVIFSETFTPKQAMMSVSMLSIAPLLAEFMMSPLQYVATQDTVNNYPLMWMWSLVFAVLALVFLVFVKENKKPVRTMTVSNFKKLITSKQVWVFGLIGISISFIRFGLSGSNIVTYVQSDFINMHPFAVAYIDFIYSIAQLVAGVLAGLYFAKRIGTKNTLMLGLVGSLLFNVIILFVSNPTILFISYSLSGFGYGLTYNSLIGLALEPYIREEREMSMAIFQTFFAIGIYYGDKIYGLILNVIPASFNEIQMYRSVFMVILIFTVLTGLAVSFGLKEKKGST